MPSFLPQINQNGFQSFFTHFSGAIPDPNANGDIIAPLWTSFNSDLIYYQQVTNGSLLDRATADINSMFPGMHFSASWLFITTWFTASYSTSTGIATFQTVLVSGDEISFLIMNYGGITPTGQPWLSGYLSTSGMYHYMIGEPRPSSLSGSTNVGIPGRWAFRTDGAILGKFFGLVCFSSLFVLPTPIDVLLINVIIFILLNLMISLSLKHFCLHQNDRSELSLLVQLVCLPFSLSHCRNM
uniref:NIDO domain-containing protein n=1 Tax=Electrophorus electricus TaxID=8005 RepID=A0A4W4HAF0_ELEEL